MKRSIAWMLALLLATAAAGVANAETLDWSALTWTAGSLGPRTYTGGALGASSVTVTVTDPSGASSSGTPALVSGVNGFDRALRTSPNFPNANQTLRSEFVFGAPVSQLSFSIGDIDTGSNSSPYTGWQDVAVITAFLGGTEVGVTITSTGAFVGVDSDGNSYATALNRVVYGTRNLDESQTSGNATFQVNGPVDRVRIDYYPGNAPDGIPGQGPNNPDNQWVHIHDLVFNARADLALTKTASTTTPTVGSTVTYTVTLANTGPAAATGVTVADVLPAGVAYVAGSIAGGTSRTATAPNLSWTVASLASGASTTLTYQATVNAPTGAANEYRNAAQVTASAQPDPDSTPNNGIGNGEDDQSTVTLAPRFSVAGFVYSDANHNATRDGGEAGTGLTLYAKLVPAATPSGPATQAVAVDPTTGAYTLTNVASGSYTVVIDTSSTLADVTPTFVAGWLGTEEADWIRSVTVTSSAVTGQNYGLYRGSRVQGVVFNDNGAGGGTAGNGVRDGGEPGLASVTVNPTATGCGGSCGSTTTDASGAFTLWIPFAANGQTVTITETNPTGFVSTGGSAGTSGGTYTLATDSVAFAHTSGSSITGVAFGDRQTADVSLTKVASSATPTVGSSITYTLTLANAGPAAATGVTVADVLPPGVSYVAGSIAGGTSRSAAGAPTLTWTQASLASGASVTLTYQATVDAPTGAANEYRNAAQVTASAQPDPDSTPNNGTGNGEDDQATVTLAPVTVVSVAGVVYADANHDATLGGSEAGTGLTLYAKLVPSATPGGPASQVVAVNPATGAFSFASVAAGTYAIVIDSSSTAADVTPTFASGWLGTEEPDGIRSVAVFTTAITGQNFGLYRGSRIEGAVFDDDGAGAGTAGNGVRDGAEGGIGGARVRASAAACGGDCDEAFTAADGAFALWIPFTTAGQTVSVIETNAAGYVSTGGSPGTTGGAYTLTTDTVAFVAAVGNVYGGVAFGDVAGNAFGPNGQRTAMPGTTVFYAHVFTAGANGAVRFSAASAPSPAIPGWAQSVFLDADCSGSLEAAESQLQPADVVAVTAGAHVCIVLRESVPPGASDGARDLVTVTAQFQAAGGASATLQATDLTTVGTPNGLVLEKSVDKTSAQPGEVLFYTITYRNAGASPISQLVIGDATPGFTTFLVGSAGCGPLPTQLTACTTTPPATPTGSITWSFAGSLAPGASGTVGYSVTIDP